MEKSVYSSAGYRRSRLSYLLQCDFEYLVSLMVTDAFLAKLLGYLGMDDATTGLISSFISLAFLVQIFTLLLTRARVRAKRAVTIFETASQLLFTFLYVIPFLPLGGVGTKLVVMGCILTAYFCQYLIVNITYRWGNSFVDPHRRASYSAAKEMVSLISGIVYTTAVGYFFDRFEETGHIQHGFIVIAVLMFLCTAANLICLLLIKPEEISAEVPPQKSLRDIFANTLGNKAFRPVILLHVFWCISHYCIAGFLGTFKTNDLKYTVFAVQLINIAANLCRVFVSRPFGRYSDKHSFARGMKLGLVVAGAAYLTVCFTTDSTRWLIIAYTVLFAVSLAGTSQNSYNIAYSYIDRDYVTEAMCIKNCIGGLCGFLISIVSSRLVNAIQAAGNTVFGVHLYAQQLLGLIALLFTVFAWLLIHFVIQRQKVIVQ